MCDRGQFINRQMTKCHPVSRVCNQICTTSKNQPFRVQQNQSRCPLNIEAWNGKSENDTIECLVQNGKACLDCGGTINFVAGNGIQIDATSSGSGVNVEISPSPQV